MSERQTKRNAFMLCAAHRSINSALLDYKKRMCDGQKINYERTINVLGV